MVLNELISTQTYNKNKLGFKQIISEHVKYMNKKVESNMEDLPYQLPKMHKTLYGKRFIAASHNVLQKQCQNYLLRVLLQ